jgi:hypothetical protein
VQREALGEEKLSVGSFGTLPSEVGLEYVEAQNGLANDRLNDRAMQSISRCLWIHPLLSIFIFVQGFEP